MRLAILPLLLLATSAVFVGCSTDSDVDGTGGSGDSVQPYQANQTNCVLMSEDDACEALMDAITSNIGRLECKPKTMPACPEYLRQSLANKEAGLFWDQGTVEECVRFYNSFDSCEQFETRPCIVRYYPKDVPTGCPEPDAGPEAATADGSVDTDASGGDSGGQDDAAPEEDVVAQDDAAQAEDAAPVEDVAVQDAAPANDAQTD